MSRRDLVHVPTAVADAAHAEIGVGVATGSSPRDPARAQYAGPMELIRTGDLVTVATRGPQLDGIAFDVPSSSKVVVAIMDRARGPVLRSVDRAMVTERHDAGPDDAQLQLLIRRTPAVNRGEGHAGGGIGSGRAGHRRASGHRTTGK